MNVTMTQWMYRMEDGSVTRTIISKFGFIFAERPTIQPRRARVSGRGIILS